MLKLLDIKKDYISGSKCSKKFPINVVEALKGVDIEFRDNEFVAILGPSGCGKTTLLNVIGGLDQYTGGELFIDSQSTKHFSDYEWDSYRNGQIGFIFQNYNLIMHQTVLANVEMALTLIGISKTEKRNRAIAALESVGLGDQINKNPNQLSGGQMQRVAIARAIINNPRIILADEPTGALDSESSVQVMDILKNLAKDRLIIMVTHNNDIAEQYASRIIKLVDGRVVSDSNPYESVFKENTALIETSKNPFVRLAHLIKRRKASVRKKIPHMSHNSAFKLSLSNLNTKKARTILTSFAGSIGIIGIALILAISSGFHNYILSTEESALSRYPIVIKETNDNNTNLFSIASLLRKVDKIDKEKFPDSDAASVSKVLANLLQNMFTLEEKNDLVSFKKYIDANFDDTLGSYKYNYKTTLNIYSNNLDEDTYTKINPFDDLMGDFLPSSLHIFLEQIKPMVGEMIIWDELIASQKLLNEQYDLMQGSWPKDKTELVLVLDEYNQISDYVLFAIGLEPPTTTMDYMLNDKTQDEVLSKTYKFEDLIGMKYRVMTNADYYYTDEAIGGWNSHDATANLDKDYVLQNSLEVEIVGIVRPNAKCKSPSINGTIGYTKELGNYLINHASQHAAVQAQEAQPTKSILQGNKTITDLDAVLAKMGKADLNKPESISFYVNSFEAKDQVLAFIDEYNKKSGKNIKYTDTLGAMMASVNEISDAITKILIAFSAISLIVSSIMIGIITYISVLERTKEIGILRSLGARKKDISRVFSSETTIIGFISGMIGVGITYLLTVPINVLLDDKLGIKGIAQFVWWHALVLIAISISLTVISGLIPSSMASKKDPVTALRSE